MKTWTEPELRELINAAAAKHGLDPQWLYGQLKHESANFNPAVIAGKRKSSAGAVGIAQFMPATSAGMKIDPLNVPEAIDGAALYMARLTKSFGNEDLARLAYNWGQGNLRKHLRNPEKFPLPAETAKYTGHVAKAAGLTAPPVLARASDVAPGGTRVAQAAARPLPQGVAPSTAGAGRGSVSPDHAAVMAALQEMNTGAPPGGAPLPSAPAGAPAGGMASDWREMVAGGPARPGGVKLDTGGDFANDLTHLLTAKVGDTQDALLAGMLNGTSAPRDNKMGLPPAVDRFLDKLLAGGAG
jgi:hypothetical protein